MIPTPPAAFENYKTGARAARAKSLGTISLGATALAAWPAVGEAQITLSSGSPVTALAYTANQNYVWFSAQNGTMSNTPSRTVPAYLYVALPGRTYFREANGAHYDFAVDANHLAVNLAPGQQVAGSNFYFTGWLSSQTLSSPWSNNTGYVGFRSQQTDGTHYGWIKLTVNNANASSVTIDSFAYDTVAGQPITAGETGSGIPEPATSAALLALGSAGLVAYRQRRKLRRAA